MPTHNTLKRRSFIGGLTAGATALAAAPTMLSAQDNVEWRMVTSWPKNSPGPGITAQRLADRIADMSNGRLTIKLYAAGELVPALEVFDGVAGGTADIGHTASFFWQGKARASVFFTAVPFGMTAPEHAAWIYHGGGQALWDELYGSFGLKPFMAGNTGIGMGGWFKKEVNSLEDVKGLKYRIPGLGGEILRQLGAVPVSVPPGEIFGALQSGVIDGAEFLGPWSDLAFGFYKAAPYYYWPGFHEPNGSGECIINLDSWQKLPPDLQAIVTNACAAENSYALAETEWHNATALETLVTKHNVEVRQFPADMLNAVREVRETVMADFASGDDITQRIYQSFEAARKRAISWSNLSTLAVLQARVGTP